jgi:hypothetical protein
MSATGHLRAGRGDAEGDVAGASSHVEDRLALAGLQAAHELVLPMPVHAARHEVVHQVVARGHVREDAADPPCLLVGRDLFVTERNLVHGA